ncbi:MAG: prephenate dehydrogenase [Terrimicrobiaceae bacterium]
MALRRPASSWGVSLWTRREESLPAVKNALPGCRVTCDLKAAVDGADLVVLCTSPHAIENSGTQLAGLLPSSTPVTDAGSVKARIVASLEQSLGGRFIGAHPMAGSEQSGISAAQPDLFEGAVCILTPTPQSNPRALETVRSFWKEAGCQLKEMSPAVHDMAVARISHLPHAAAAALVHAALSKNPEAAILAGSGYRDSTRVALGPEELWREIFLDNREELLSGISDLQISLETLKNALSRGDGEAIEAFLREARSLRS